MSGNNFNGLLRACVSMMYSKSGIKAVDSIGGYSLSDEAKDFLKELVTLVMETDYFKPDTKAYLSSKFSTFRSSNIVDGCAENKNTSRSRINYDLSKLRCQLGDDAMEIIIKHKNTDLSRYRERIKCLWDKHKSKSLLDGFTIKIPECNELVSELLEEKIITLLGLARMLSRKGIKESEKYFTPDMVGYIRYLEHNLSNLNEEEMEYYSALAEWLK